MMDKIIKKKIGNDTHTYVVRGEDFHAVEMEAKKLSFSDVSECGLCQSVHLYVTAYVTKEEKYKYVKIVCKKCGASLTFGQPKAEPGTFYLRKTQAGAFDWKPKEDREKSQSNTTPDTMSDAPPPTGDDDMPF